MGVIGSLLATIFGNDRNVLRDTAEVFRPNAEADAQRAVAVQLAALTQHGGEFAQPGKGWFDRMMDGINRLPRPAMALGTLGLFVAAMVDPVWFAARMTGLALVPDPLWWLLGAIVSFYFGARHQAKGQAFQREIAQAMVQTAPQVVQNVSDIEALRGTEDGPKATPEAAPANQNAALADWRRDAG